VWIDLWSIEGKARQLVASRHGRASNQTRKLPDRKPVDQAVC
jgi:hypothetical protein